MASSSTGKLVAHALASAQKVVEHDTEVSTIDLNLLENLNTNQSLNYIKLEQQLEALEATSAKSSLLTDELASLMEDLDHIEAQVDAVVDVTEELRQWCNEMESEKKKTHSR